MSPKFKIIVTETQDTKIRQFVREDDGMVIGITQDGSAQFGEDPRHAEPRVFTDHDYAIAWLKKKCREMCGREDVTFTEVVDRKILIPAPQVPPLMRKM